MIATFIPELLVDQYQSYKNEDYENVIQMHQEIIPLLELFKIDSPTNIAKEAIKLRGIDITTEVLAHLCQIDEEKIAAIKMLLQSHLKEYTNIE